MDIFSAVCLSVITINLNLLPSYYNFSGMDILSAVCLSVIISMEITFNAFAIIFIRQKHSRKTLKDKIVMIMCVMNMAQSISYGIELKSAIEGTCPNRPLNEGIITIAGNDDRATHGM